MMRTRALALAALAAAAAIALPRPAAAHGPRWPSSIGLTMDSSAAPPPVQWIALSFGPVWSRDGGATWAWACEEGLGYPDWFDPTYVLRPDGSLVTSVPAGVERSTDDGCSWTVTPVGPAGAHVTSMALHASSPDEFFVTWTLTAASGGIERSTDGGLTFTPVLERPDVSMVRLVWSPADATRLYALTQSVDQTTYTLLRSDDGGAAWTDLPLDAAFGSAVPALLAAGRDDPDVVWLARRPGTSMDVLVRSGDGGATFADWGDLGAGLVAFAERADGSVWVSSSAELLYSPDGAAGLAPAPGTPPGTARCLYELPDGLYACAENYVDGYSVGRTVDGSTWEPVFVFEDIDGLLDCPAGTPVADVCTPLWPQVKETYASPPAGASDAGTGGGGGGCRCAAVPGRGAPAAPLLLLAALCALVAAKRRT
jgi:hypothetical protein